ncbi:hypothetical protein SUDANB95_02720 [Actinosynnema sp. ALI-1.44]
MAGLGVAVVLSTVTGVLSRNDHDAYLIEDPRIVEVAVPACAEMARGVRATVLPEDPVGRVSAIRAQNAHVLTMVGKVRALGPGVLNWDQPANKWLGYWEKLVEARAEYADGLAAGRPVVWVVPSIGANGKPVTERLDSVGIDCAVPAVLTTLP